MLNKVKKIAPILLIVIVIAAAAFVYLRVAAPTGVQAHPGDSEVSLSWNAANVAGYNVEYMPEDGRWSTTNATLNSCTITGLSNGTVYTFRINAIGKNGLVSSYSAMVSATPRPVVETPTAQPKGGEVKKDTKVALTTATDGAVIYYTTD
ncbi:MAG: fibronectin type III domain-containing protein, partial [Syntrophomonadaceae bacterium]